jgi:hypothetical protein
MCPNMSERLSELAPGKLALAWISPLKNKVAQDGGPKTTYSRRTAIAIAVIKSKTLNGKCRFIPIR